MGQLESARDLLLDLESAVRENPCSFHSNLGFESAWLPWLEEAIQHLHHALEQRNPPASLDLEAESSGALQIVLRWDELSPSLELSLERLDAGGKQLPIIEIFEVGYSLGPMALRLRDARPGRYRLLAEIIDDEEIPGLSGHKLSGTMSLSRRLPTGAVLRDVLPFSLASNATKPVSLGVFEVFGP